VSLPAVHLEKEGSGVHDDSEVVDWDFLAGAGQGTPAEIDASGIQELG
jgi:hypothetical protein